MSSKGISETGQVVHRTTDAESSQRVQDGDSSQHINTPPPYSGPSSPSIGRLPTIMSYPGLPLLNYSLYSPSNFKLSSDETTVTTYRPESNTYPAVLSSLIQSQASIPPKAQIHIKGATAGRIDFYVKLNIMSLLVGDNAPKERWNYLKIIDDGELGWRGDTKMTSEPNVSGGLDQWAQRYCADASSIKQFTLERIVTNWDTAYLESRLHSLIASTSYRGEVSITFPLTFSKVIVHSPDKVNRLFTNMTHLFTGTKTYAVVKAVWPYASVPPDTAGRIFATQSEERWWAEWKDAIRHAILSRRQGWVTVEDRLEFLMAPTKETGRPMEWGGAA